MAILSPYLPINYLSKWSKFSSQKIQNFFQETRKISNKQLNVPPKGFKEEQKKAQSWQKKGNSKNQRGNK